MRKTMHFLIVGMLVFAMIQSFFPLITNDDVDVSADTPDDGVDGLQYIKGDWVVTGPENYTDEFIVLTGNLTIESGGSLTLKNVTLAMNCTTSDYDFEINVLNGGSLTISDVDGDPTTKNDFSNLTDSPFDTNDTSGGGEDDYHFYIYIYDSASFSLTNSFVRECNSIYTWADNINVQNCTFTYCYNPIFIREGDNHIIAHNDISNTSIGIGLDYQINNTLIHHNEVWDSKWGIHMWGGWSSSSIINNTIIHDNIFHDNGYGIYSMSEIHNTYIYNNIIYDSDFWGMDFGGRNSIVHDNEVYNNIGGMWIRGNNVTTNHNTVYNNVQTGLYLGFLQNSEIFKNTIENNSGIYWNPPNLEVKYCDNLEIHYNDIQKLRTGSAHAVYMRYNSNITFHNNVLIDNDNSDSTLKVDIEEFDTNYKFINNFISNNEGFGMYIHGYTLQPSERHSIEIIDNDILDNNLGGLALTSLRQYNITGNTISSSRLGSWGLRVEDIRDGDFSNNTVYGDSYDFVLCDTYGDPSDTYFEVTNCTCDPSKVWMMSEWPTIVFQHFLHVNVTDMWGQAPNVYVEVFNEKGNNVSSGYTGYDGYLRWIRCANQSLQGDDIGPPIITYYDPHNITAYSWAYTAYGEVEPVMDHPQTVNVVFNVDLPPEPPSRLTAASDWTDVVLNWEPCHSPDLHHYVIYKLEPGFGWQLAYDQDGTGDEKLTYWVDPNAASDWATYYYKVQAVDNGYQLSEFSEVAMCGDWAIPDTQEYTNFAVQLNGSLIILPGGNLTFKHVDIKFNCSEKAQFGVDVRPGGEFYVLDFDDNPQTVNDRTNVSAVNPDNTLYFMMAGSKLVMKNSELKDCGSDYLFEYWWWDIEDSAPYVMEKGEPSLRGLYITGGDVTIKNNNFMNNFVSILIHGAGNAKISGNTFTDAKFGVYLCEAIDNKLKENTFATHEAFPIYIYNSENNEILSNQLTYDGRGGVVLYDKGSGLNKIKGNNFSEGNYGIHFRNCGNDNNVTNNNFTGIGTVINLEDTDWTKFSYNYFYNIGGVMSVENSDFTTINNEYSNFSNSGYFLEEANSTTITNLKIENVSNLGMVISLSRDYVVSNISIKSPIYGIGIVAGQNMIFEDVTIEDCFWGLIILSDEDLEISSNNIDFHNSIIHNGVEEAVVIWNSENIKLVNCTLNATGLNYNLTESHVISMNTTYNQTRVNINYSSISIHWILHVQVMDWQSSPVSNAHVQVRKALGTLVYDGYTDMDGFVRWLWLHERTQYSHSNETSTPHFIFADLGNHSGSSTIMINQSTQTTVYLENDPPSVSNLIIGPSYPSTLDDLTLNYTYTDPENDPEDSSVILWYVNGTHNPLYNNFKTISNSYTYKGQTWFCEVIPYDGSAYGIAMPSIPVIIQNTPPEVSNVLIEETNPRSEDSLHVNYTFSDIDGDLETWSLHRWYFWNGVDWEYSGVDSEELGPLYTQKGELWKCRVTPGDGDDYGEFNDSNVVMINNTAPEVSEVGIKPDSPMSGEQISVDYKFFDLDDDSESGSIIIWFKDDVEQVDLNGSTFVDSSRTAKGEKWHYIVIPSDGEDLGSPEQSKAVYIENTPPSVSNVMIQPQYPTTGDNLTVTYNYIDDDGDAEGLDTIVEWLLWSGFEFIKTGLRVNTLSSAYTTKGDIWICQVTPHDNHTYGNTVLSSTSVTIMNSKPTVSNVHITPSNPTTLSDLQVNYDYSDLNKDGENGTKIVWYCNEVPMNKYDNKLTIPNHETEKDQVWYCEVLPKDGFEFGTVVKSENITIQNSPPTATNLIISPSSPLGNEDLEALYDYIDDDDDPESTPEIRWYKNGLLQPIYNDLFIVNSSATKKGQTWYFILRVSDGEDKSGNITSYHVVIENTQPLLNSISPPPGTLILNETDSIEFYTDVTDPDGDYLIYGWKLGFATVSSNDYYLFETYYESTGDYKSNGTYTLNLTIQDLGERSFPLYGEWTIIVKNLNRMPEISSPDPLEKELHMKEDTSQKFSIVAKDLDSDNLETTWYLDDVVAQEGGSSYTYHAGLTAAGDHVVHVIVDDGTDTAEYSWNLTVQNVEENEDLIFGLNWDQWSIVLEIMVIGGSGLLAFIGYNRIRKKKGALKIYMKEIDEISTKFHDEPRQYEQKLNDIEARINIEFMEGKIEDLHYLMLQEIIATRRGEIRKAEVTRKFEGLPEGIMEELDEMLKDGRISREEYEGFVTTISMTTTLTADEKEELSRMIEKWKVEDKEIVKEEPVSKKDKPQKPIIQEIEERQSEEADDLDEIEDSED